jgi:hypothetical protein
MKINKKTKLIIFILLISTIILFACNLPFLSSPNVETGALFTEAAATLRAMTEIAGQITPSPTPTNNGLTMTPVVTIEITPIPSETEGVCVKASFIRDVNVPDGTILPPSTNFTKIWKIRNDGTCTWTTDYAIVFADGYSMGANAAIHLADAVEPGETVEFALELTAPLAPGTYRGDWKLRNTSGVVFGLGNSGTNAFWVEIEVKSQETDYKFDFAYNICSADWSSSSGEEIDCPNGPENSTGFIKYLTEPNLEGSKDDELGLLINPGVGIGSWVEGIFPITNISNGDHFQTLIACEGGSENCSLKFILSIYEGETKIIIGDWVETYEGLFTSINIELSTYAGKNVRIALRIENRVSSSGDANGIWFVPTLRD